MYNAIKTDLATFLGISKDALHIHIGLAIVLILIVILRRPPASIIPWFGVLAFEVVNELFDVFHWHQSGFSFEIGDAFKDIANTMFWPTITVLAFRIVAVRQRKRSVVQG